MVPTFEIIDQAEPSNEVIAALARLLLATVDDDDEAATEHTEDNEQ